MRRPAFEIKAAMSDVTRARRSADRRLEKANQALELARGRFASMSVIAQRQTAALEARGEIDALDREQRDLERELAGDWAPPAWEPDSAA